MPAQQLAEKRKSAAKFTPIPYNPSSQRLMMKGGELSEIDLAGNFYTPVSTANRTADGRSSEESLGAVEGSFNRSPNHISRTQWVTVIVLFFVNLIKYMDRLTIAGKDPNQRDSCLLRTFLPFLGLEERLLTTFAKRAFLIESSPQVPFRPSKFWQKSYDFFLLLLASSRACIASVGKFNCEHSTVKRKKMQQV